MDNIDRGEFQSKIKSWFENSGKMKELQTKLRKDLFQVMQENLTEQNQDFYLKLRQPEKTSEKTAVLNWLIAEHLVQNEYWLTHSILTNEAVLQHSLPPLVLSQQAGSKLKHYEYSRVSDEMIVNLVTALGFRNNVPLCKDIISSYGKSRESLLSTFMSALVRATKESTSDVAGASGASSTSNPSKQRLPATPRKQQDSYFHLEKSTALSNSVASNLQSINVKYDRLLEEVIESRDDVGTGKGKNRRNNFRKPDAPSFPIENGLPMSNGFAEVNNTPSEDSDRSKVAVKNKHHKNRHNKEDESTPCSVSEKELYYKIEEFLALQSDDRMTINELKESLKSAELEIKALQTKLVKHESTKSEDSNENVVKELSKIALIQMEKIQNQEQEMAKLKEIIESRFQESILEATLDKTSQKSDLEEHFEEDKIFVGRENEGACHVGTNTSNNQSPTTDFLLAMKEKLKDVEKEEKSILGAFDDYRSHH